MKRFATITPLAYLLFVPVLIFAVSGSARAQEKNTQEAAPSQEELFTVPDGSPEELLQYIQKLKDQKPPAQGLEEVRDFQKKQREAIVRAANKILDNEPNDEQLEQAIIAKVAAIHHLTRYGEGHEKRLEEIPETLKKAGHRELARDVKAFLLERELRQSRAAEPEDLDKLLDRVQEFLAEGPIGEQGVRLAIATARAVEGGGSDPLAAKAYRELGELLAKSDEQPIADVGGRMQGIARRFDLVGNQIELEGVTADGDPLHWPDYRGRVTLVMFWATWCGPCRREMVHVQDLYEQYHDRGFEVVGISVDDSRENVEEFLEKNEIPWTTVFDQARAEAKKGPPMSVRYGVMGIPYTLLVNRKGKVVATGIRGPELDERLEEMIGPGQRGSVGLAN